MSPSRCPDCQSRLLQPHGVMDTFERYDVCYWQCVSCGLVFDCAPRGRSVRMNRHQVAPITLAPGELNILTRESHARTIGKVATKKGGRRR